MGCSTPLNHAIVSCRRWCMEFCLWWKKSRSVSIKKCMVLCTQRSFDICFICSLELSECLVLRVLRGIVSIKLLWAWTKAFDGQMYYFLRLWQNICEHVVKMSMLCIHYLSSISWISFGVHNLVVIMKELVMVFIINELCQIQSRQLSPLK